MTGLLGFDPYRRLAERRGEPAKAANPAKVDADISSFSDFSSNAPVETLDAAERDALACEGVLDIGDDGDELAAVICDARRMAGITRQGKECFGAPATCDCGGRYPWGAR